MQANSAVETGAVTDLRLGGQNPPSFAGVVGDRIHNVIDSWGLDIVPGTSFGCPVRKFLMCTTDRLRKIPSSS